MSESGKLTAPLRTAHLQAPEQYEENPLLCGRTKEKVKPFDCFQQRLRSSRAPLTVKLILQLVNKLMIWQTCYFSWQVDPSGTPAERLRAPTRPDDGIIHSDDTQLKADQSPQVKIKKESHEPDYMRFRHERLGVMEELHYLVCIFINSLIGNLKV